MEEVTKLKVKILRKEIYHHRYEYSAVVKVNGQFLKSIGKYDTVEELTAAILTDRDITDELNKS